MWFSLDQDFEGSKRVRLFLFPPLGHFEGSGHDKGEEALQRGERQMNTY